MTKSDSSPVRTTPTDCDGLAVSEGTLCVPAKPPYLSLIGMVVQFFGHRAGLSDETCYELEVAIDEVCSNVIRYAYPETAPGQISVRCSPLPRGLRVDVVDQGRPFDPTEGHQIARDKQARDPASGGLGLSMIRQFADECRHHWDEQEGNRLTIIKYRKG